MGLRAAFAYVITGAILMSSSVKLLLGAVAAFNIFGIGVDLIVSLTIWLVGLGYLVSGLWFFFVLAMIQLNKFTGKLPGRPRHH
jgi:hypothetical protein